MADITADDIYESLKILDLPKKVSINEIKKYYRKLSLKYHPDKCPDENCKEQIHKITEAYKILIEFLENYEFDLSNLHSDKEQEDNYKKRFYDNFFDIHKE